MSQVDVIKEVMSLVESRVEVLKQELKGIDAELSALNAEIEAKMARKFDLIARRNIITKLLQVLEPAETYIQNNNSKRRDSELDEKVYRLVQEHPDGLTQLQIAKALDKPPSTIYHAINRLIADGKVVKDGSLLKPA
jgi:maltooligosyltrehalose synthase